MGLGALLLGVHENGRLRYVGRSAPGSPRRPRRRCDPARPARPRAEPFADHAPAFRARGGCGQPWSPRWRSRMDPDGRLRHPSFRASEGQERPTLSGAASRPGHRQRSPANPWPPAGPARAGSTGSKDMTRPRSQDRVPPGGQARHVGEPAAGRGTITHPERIVYPDKAHQAPARAVLRARRRGILTHLRGDQPRWCAVRKDCAGVLLPEAHRELGHEALRRVQIQSGTRSESTYRRRSRRVYRRVQMGILEIHTWNARADRRSSRTEW